MYTTKDSVEMMKEAVGEGYDSARQLGELNLRTWNRIVEKQMDVFGLWMDTAAKQIELASTVSDYKAFAGAQVELAREVAETLVEKGRESMQAAGESREEYRSWLEVSVNKATAKWNKAAQQSH